MSDFINTSPLEKIRWAEEKKNNKKKIEFPKNKEDGRACLYFSSSEEKNRG